MSTQLFLGIIAAILLLLLAFLIPVILQVRSTAKSVEDFLKDTERSLSPLLVELRASVEKANRVTEGLEDSVSSVQHLARSIGDASSIIDEINGLIRHTGLAFSLRTASLGIGIKTALNVLAKGIVKKSSSKKEDD